jgi:septal ring factor EnvC (AmiA/AmiB activator)
MSDKHRKELQKFEDTINQQREQLATLDSKLLESDRTVTTLQNKLRNN